ncbi:MAG TPA: DUF1194 domain-containing protein [Methyloceanibacter sp.]|nr:DUF1194 domain-containing protein [Methyloceanibacter sp.]
MCAPSCFSSGATRGSTSSRTCTVPPLSPATKSRSDTVATQSIINGLPILNDRRQPLDLAIPVELAFDDYYRDNVIGGAGSFVIPVHDFSDFRNAILSKLIREIAGVPVRAGNHRGTARLGGKDRKRAQEAAAADCGDGLAVAGLPP